LRPLGLASSLGGPRLVDAFILPGKLSHTHTMRVASPSLGVSAHCAYLLPPQGNLLLPASSLRSRAVSWRNIPAITPHVSKKRISIYTHSFLRSLEGSRRSASKGYLRRTWQGVASSQAHRMGERSRALRLACHGSAGVAGLARELT